MAFVPTYFLAPSLGFKETGPIALGSIIADPFRPDRVLTSVTDAEIASRYPLVDQQIEEASSISFSKGHSVSLSVWAQFLQSIKFGPSGKVEGDVSMEFSMDSLTTRYFLKDPEEAEIAARIAERKIRRVMKADRPIFSEPVYMVTGIKIAKALVASNSKSKGTDLGAELGGSGPTPIGDVGAGIKVNDAHKSSFTHKRTLPENVVFAYQLLQIKLKGWKNKELVLDEFKHKAAFLSHEEHGEDDKSTADGDDLQVISQPLGAEDITTLDDENVAVTKVLGDKEDQVRVVMFSDQS